MISVLYVDDEPKLRDLTRIFLEREEGISVILLDSGEETLRFLADKPVDVIVSDYQMDGLSGLDLLREIRKKFGSVPFILFTGRGREDVAIEALNRGASFYLQKGGDPQTQYTELVHMIRQAVQHRIMMEELRESEERLTRVLEGTRDGFFDWDLARDEAAASSRVFEILGYRSGEILAKDLLTPLFLHPDDSHRVIRAFQEHLKGTTPQFNEEFRMRTKSGIYLWVNGRARVVEWDDAGKAVRAAGALTDISDRKKADQSLVNLNQRLSLINNLTRHDLLNDLTAILGYLSFMEDAQSSEELAVYRQKMEASAKRMHRHLEFARDYHEMGKEPARFIPVEGALSKALIGIDLTNLKLSVELDEFEILADHLLEKVLFNLFDNAKRHGGTSLTTVKVTYRETERGLTIVIEDDGSGIPSIEKHLIFQKGFGKNTGLGLFLAREALQITGITIEETGEPGQGARFEITIPPGSYRRKTPVPETTL